MFDRIRRYIPELDPKRIKKNVQRFWKIHVNPPKERSIYLRPENLPIIASRVDSVTTKGQPKQVVYDEKTHLAFVSCMDGHSLQVFNIGNNSIEFEDEVHFEDQCVEVLLGDDKIFVTTTNFERPPHEIRNKLWILDTNTRKIISSLNTGGNWSKLIALNPSGNELLVSNWHSHNISVIDVSNVADPKLKQIVQWGEAPRGIAFTPDGNNVVVTGFYSGNLGILNRNLDDQKWKSVYTSEPFDHPNYHGNMRHVLIDANGENAVISNLGRNLIHVWSIQERKFKFSIPVGKSPNSIDWVNEQEKEITVSCRDSGYVYRVDLEKKKVIGRSQKTGGEPTGLCSVDDGFLVTGFTGNTLEFHKFI